MNSVGRFEDEGGGRGVDAEKRKRAIDLGIEEGVGVSVEEKMRKGKIRAGSVRSASAPAVSAFAPGRAASSSSTPDLSVST